MILSKTTNSEWDFVDVNWEYLDFNWEDLDFTWNFEEFNWECLDCQNQKRKG